MENCEIIYGFDIGDEILLEEMKELRNGFSRDGYDCKYIGEIGWFGKSVKVNLLFSDTGKENQPVGNPKSLKELLHNAKVRRDDMIEVQTHDDNFNRNLKIYINDINKNMVDVCTAIDESIKYENTHLSVLEELDGGMDRGLGKENTDKNLKAGSRIYLRLLGRKILYASKPIIDIPVSDEKTGFILHLVKLSGWFKSSWFFYRVVHVKGGNKSSYGVRRFKVDIGGVGELKEVLESYLKGSN